MTDPYRKLTTMRPIRNAAATILRAMRSVPRHDRGSVMGHVVRTMCLNCYGPAYPWGRECQCSNDE